MPDAISRVDRAEIAKLIERAEKLLQKGKTPDALDIYLLALEQDTSNDTIRQMAADLCLSLQRVPDAVRFLGELFDHQTAAGDATHASITYKKLSRYVNPGWQQKVSFGQLLENSNRKLAVETYENAFEELIKQSRQNEALMVLNRIVGLDSGQRNLLRLAQLSSDLGDGKAAAAAFLRAAELSDASGGDSAQWFERAYQEDSSDPKIAFAYAKTLLAQQQFGAAIFVLEPHLHSGTPSLDMRDAYAKALLAANRLAEAEPFVWQLFEHNPVRVNEIASLIGGYLDGNQEAEAVTLARKLEAFQRRRGERRSFIAMMQEITASHRPSAELLEFMSELFNASNRETDYCQTLLKLFDLHFEAGNFGKAAECLDRAVEVDAYESGHQKRLESLHGKIDDTRYKLIASRLSNLNKSVAEPLRAEEPTLGAAALQDLMLQAEILVQYGMRGKAVERLQRIQELFPHEEDRNPDLQKLYLSAGVVPRYSNAAASAPPQSPAPPARTATSAPQAAASADSSEVNSFTRVAEITRKLYRQGNADAVLTTGVNEIGTHWKATRCIAAMRKPGLPPTAVKENCSEGVQPGAANSLARLVAAVQDLAIARGTLAIPDAAAVPEFQPVREALSELRVVSLLALPLSDGTDQVGVVLLTQDAPRAWQSGDIMVLKTVADQLVIALNNAGLRQLVRNLSVTDERSGLLKRASYLDLLMAETRRAVQQATTVSILLMQFGKAGAMMKEFGETAIESMMQQIGQLFAANIRQNDLAFRYGTTTVAIVLGETAEKEALLAIEKLKKLLSQIHLPGKEDPVRFSAGLAEAVVRQQYDPADIVTEVINRADLALDMAIAQGPNKVVPLAASLSNSAVA